MKDRLSYIRKRQKPPFTLVELLVVMVIILILAAMLLPALNKAKGSAHTAVCNSNLGQFGKILGMYSTDTDGTFAGPIVGDGTTCNVSTPLDDKSVWWQVYHEAGYYEGADTTAADYWLNVGINWCPSDIEFKTADMSTTVTYADAGVDANAWNGVSPNTWSPLGSTYGCFMWYRSIESNAANLCVAVNAWAINPNYTSVAVGFINNITESTLLMEQEGVVWKGAGYPGQFTTYGNPVFTW
jgi:prepilin-type N-terminal cleavage/methylation domain-containing protein